jgi:hypothetical protein
MNRPISSSSSGNKRGNSSTMVTFVPSPLYSDANSHPSTKSRACLLVMMWRPSTGNMGRSGQEEPVAMTIASADTLASEPSVLVTRSLFCIRQFPCPLEMLDAPGGKQCGDSFDQAGHHLVFAVHHGGGVVGEPSRQFDAEIRSLFDLVCYSELVKWRLIEDRRF